MVWCTVLFSDLFLIYFLICFSVASMLPQHTQENFPSMSLEMWDASGRKVDVCTFLTPRRF